MRIKNISKKVIGNEKFQLLPGDEMEVVGDETWVNDYLNWKKLQVITQDSPKQVPLAVEEQPGAADQRVAEAKAEKELKKTWAAILKNGDSGEILKLADELGIPTDNVSQDELIGMIKIAIK